MEAADRKRAWRGIRLALGLTASLIAVLPVSGHAQPYRPALLNEAAELTYIRGRIQAGADPWKSAFARMKSSDFASLSYAPKPREIVECGSYSKPDYGCSDESADSKAAYTHALMG